ncbi:MAG: hypothetical protein ISR45_06855 [Rhodospirillales bacterium]|nr:hypothetical protein [Rhodospirillales bacterium]
MSSGKDQIVERAKERLSKFNGSIEVQQYPKGSDVTYGAAEDEMFGRAPRIPPPQSASKSSETPTYIIARTHTNFNPEILKMLQLRWTA